MSHRHSRVRASRHIDYRDLTNSLQCQRQERIARDEELAAWRAEHANDTTTSTRSAN